MGLAVYSKAHRAVTTSDAAKALSLLCEAAQVNLGSIEVREDTALGTNELGGLVSRLRAGDLSNIYSDEFYEVATRFCELYSQLLPVGLDARIKPFTLTELRDLKLLSKEVLDLLIQLHGKNPLHGQRVKSGMERAKAKGGAIGAPRGNLNRRGKTKEYDPSQIGKIVFLLGQNKTYREIVALVPFPISIGTISNIRKKIESRQIKVGKA